MRRGTRGGLAALIVGLAALALFGEAIGPVQFTGAAIVLAGIWISRKGS